MNGQHSSEALRDSDTQLALLDRVAGTGVLAAKASATLTQMGDIEERLESFDTLSDPEERNSLRKLVDAVSHRRARRWVTLFGLAQRSGNSTGVLMKCERL
jgi:hypothetical protein